MGWTTMNDRYSSRQEGIVDLMERYAIPKDRYSVVKGVVYAVANHTETGKRVAVIIPTDFENGQFSYNPFSEADGPMWHDCPQKIMKQLDSVDGYGYSSSWRRQCRELADNRKRVANGEMFTFEDCHQYPIFNGDHVWSRTLRYTAVLFKKDVYQVWDSSWKKLDFYGRFDIDSFIKQEGFRMV